MTQAQQSTERARDGRASRAYERTAGLIADGRCVVLDGAVGTELPRVATARGTDERLWGTRALIDAPDLVLDVHRRYVAAGCDVISTNTWGLTAEMQGQRTGHLAPLQAD